MVRVIEISAVGFGDEAVLVLLHLGGQQLLKHFLFLADGQNGEGTNAVVILVLLAQHEHFGLVCLFGSVLGGIEGDLNIMAGVDLRQLILGIVQLGKEPVVCVLPVGEFWLCLFTQQLYGLEEQFLGVVVKTGCGAHDVASF